MKKNKIVIVEYQRIKRPKKDEVLIFKFPNVTDIQAMNHFKQCIDNKEHDILLTDMNVKVEYINRKNINWQTRYETK